MERGMGGRRRLRTVGGAGGCNRLLRSSPAGSEEWQEEQRLAFCSTRLQTARAHCSFLSTAHLLLFNYCFCMCFFFDI
ncbi:hypothetical protein DAI22_09g002332 [Oryza sativa Japonica Group]|nr:hypothetical protein DAI22_09g002332 [Oryza sativa Japonica Group]